MNENGNAFQAGDVLPRMIGVMASNVIDGMWIWGEVKGDEITLTPYAFLVEQPARPTSSGQLRVEAVSPVDGPTFLLFERNDVVLVELAS